MLIEHNWPKADPDFYRIVSTEDKVVRIRADSRLEIEFYKYAMNFNKSAHILTEHILESGYTRQLDTYFFAVAYLYRHSLELILKAIGFKFITDKEERKEFIKATFHNLSMILQTIEPYLTREINSNTQAFIWIKKLFTDMSEIDKESDSFRYPFGIVGYRKEPFSDKKFRIKAIFEKQTHIDLASFVDKMEISFNILTCFYSESLVSIHNYDEYEPILLEEGGDYYTQSVVGYYYNKNKFHPYVSAYTESANYLYECMMRDRRVKEDLFLPMCYLYRNGIELAMKEILFEECSFDHQKALFLLKDRKHSFSRLWNTISYDINQHVNATTDDTTIQHVEKYISQLHKIDGTSDKFRYPTDKFLVLHFKDEKRFDVQNVASFFCELGSFLNGVCMQMSHQNDMKADYEAEMRSYYE